jgi:high-affinity iron transporter
MLVPSSSSISYPTTPFGSFLVDTNNFQFGNPEISGGGGWGIFNAVLGWQNSATYGSVISYNVYWLCVILGFLTMRYSEVHGHLPLMKPKKKEVCALDSGSVNVVKVDSEEKKSAVEV